MKRNASVSTKITKAHSAIEALEILKQSSRRYAKRQLTWFRHVDAKRIMVDDELGNERNFDDILAEALEIIKTHNEG